LPGRRVTATPVRSYRTFSPLPARTHVRLELGRFVSVALSRGFPRVGFPTTLPCGVRTFLEGPVVSPASPRLLGQPLHSNVGGWAVLAPPTRAETAHASKAPPPSRQSTTESHPSQRAAPSARRMEARHTGHSTTPACWAQRQAVSSRCSRVRLRPSWGRSSCGHGAGRLGASSRAELTRPSGKLRPRGRAASRRA
jgi:hypothetical protein